jgi:hypothetical protein
MNLIRRHPVKLTLFALLSLLDLGLTYKLLHAHGGSVYEANPLANAWLHRFGWTGLAVYKLLAVTMFAAATAYIGLRRPRLGARLMNFACLTVFAVVAYSLALSNRVGAREPTYTFPKQPIAARVTRGNALAYNLPTRYPSLAMERRVP